MKFNLTDEEISMLNSEGIEFDPAHEYLTEDEQLDFMDEVRDLEVKYALRQEAGMDDPYRRVYFSHLADKVQDQVPDD